jgi:hypothetical protein
MTYAATAAAVAERGDAPPVLHRLILGAIAAPRPPL